MPGSKKSDSKKLSSLPSTVISAPPAAPAPAAPAPAKEDKCAPVRYRNRKIEIQSGMSDIGRNREGKEFKEDKQVVHFTVIFPKPFKTTPNVTANTLQASNYGEIKDTYALSIRSISTTEFKAQVVRVDQGEVADVAISVRPTGRPDVPPPAPCDAVIHPSMRTWDQNLRVSWIAVANQAE